MPIPRNRNRSTTLSVFDHLLEQIVSGELEAGTVIREKALCAELEVSRTVVREALARLAQLNVIRMKQGGDTTVLDYRYNAGLDLLPWLLLRRPEQYVDPVVMRAGIEMRAALVPEIAALCAQRGIPGTHARMSSLVERMKETEDLPTRQRLSLEFWGMAAEATDNVAYLLAFNTVKQALDLMREKIARGMEPELNDIDGYVAIARAISKRDEAAARKAAAAHVEIGLTQLQYVATKKKDRR